MPAELVHVFARKQQEEGLRGQGGEDLSEASRTDLEVVARSNQESRS